nr:hypothetical protein B7L52_10635 [Pectobacterium carotovorum]
MTGKKKLGQKRVSLLTSAQVSPAIGGNVLLEHYTILNLCGNAPVWLCDASHGISACGHDSRRQALGVFP